MNQAPAAPNAVEVVWIGGRENQQHNGGFLPSNMSVDRFTQENKSNRRKFRSQTSDNMD